MTPEDRFTVTISMKIDRVTGGEGKEGEISSMNIVYNNMDYGDVVGVEALISTTLIPALVGAGLQAAETMGIDMTPVKEMNAAGKNAVGRQ